MTGARRLTALALVGAFAAATPAGAALTRSWTDGATELQQGESSGIAVTSRARLFLAPRLTLVGRPLPSGDPAQIWSMAADDAGNLYLGTGPEGKLLRVTPSGEKTVLFTASEPLVTAVTVLPGGDVLAATSPEGKIFRIGRDGTSRLWSEAKTRYVWALAPGPDGSVLAATGEQGVILRIDRDGSPTPFFDSEESHVVSLASASDGALLAGGAGRGLVYRVDREGRAIVHHDDDLAEAKAVVPEPGGGVLVALLAPPEPDRRPPAVRIQVGGGAEVGAAPEGASDLGDRRGQVLQGVIEGLPEAAEEDARRLRGRIVRVAPDGTVSELWRSSSEAPYALALDSDGRPLFGVGEPARIYRIEPDGEVSLLATLREGQVTALLRVGRAVVAATSNPGSLYRLDRENPESGTFLSRPIDAGGLARWGTLRWRTTGTPGRVELFTRTGNSADPDETWSAWSPALTDPASSAVPNPDGRYLQWRVKMFGGGGVNPERITAATVTYSTRNRAPAIRDLRADTGPSVAGKVGFRWNGQDADGDPVTVEIQYRRAGETGWATGFRLDPTPPKPGEPAPDPETSWRDAKAMWDTTVADEGVYEVRAMASDQAWNPPGEGKEAVLDLSHTITVDRTPPRIEARRVSGGAIEIDVSDALSPVVRLEVVVDGRPAFLAPASDGLADGATERFRLPANALPPSGAPILRAVDAAGNASESPIPAP